MEPVASIELSGEPLGTAEARKLARTADSLREDRSVRVVVVRSAGDDFCPGAADDLDRGEVDVAASVAALRPPVVALVAGRCASVGLELALACDIRLAAGDARFALDDVVTSGKLPCWGGTQRLPRAVGVSLATRMLLLGEEVGSGAAGLTHGDAADVDAVVEALLTNGPLALELAKEAVHRGSELPLRDGLRLEGELNHLLQSTADRAEGIAAFLSKRPPDFAGR